MIYKKDTTKIKNASIYLAILLMLYYKHKNTREDNDECQKTAKSVLHKKRTILHLIIPSGTVAVPSICSMAIDSGNLFQHDRLGRDFFNISFSGAKKIT